MRRIAPFVLSLALAGFAFVPVAAQDKAEKTIKGEVIDVKCGKGKGHEQCATQCVRGGTEVGIKVGDEVFVITGDYTADKNAKLIEFVAKDVEATGEITEGDHGHKTIKVSAIKLATAK